MRVDGRERGVHCLFGLLGYRGLGLLSTYHHLRATRDEQDNFCEGIIPRIRCRPSISEPICTWDMNKPLVGTVCRRLLS